jgi:hypothetical protein
MSAVTGFLAEDKLVGVIFEAVKAERANPEERRLAVVRAGLIAQIYGPLDSTTEKIFGSLAD